MTYSIAGECQIIISYNRKCILELQAHGHNTRCNFPPQKLGPSACLRLWWEINMVLYIYITRPFHMRCAWQANLLLPTLKMNMSIQLPLQYVIRAVPPPDQIL
jgi:hypothetical protein